MLLFFGLAFSLVELVLGLATTISREEDDLRLIQYSTSAREYIPRTALEYLLSIRDEKPESLSDVLSLKSSLPILYNISDEAIVALTRREGYRVGYIDITDIGGLDTFRKEDEPTLASFPPPDASLHPALGELFGKVSKGSLQEIITDLSTKFKTRFYLSSGARAPALYIRDYFARIQGNINVTLFENSFDQPNVIARLTPPNATSSDLIILGGHLDSISEKASIEAPGADDDASGLATAMHIFALVAQSPALLATLRYPIEVHAYAGEEGGLLGSLPLAKEYKAKGVKIRGMLNLEMVGWQIPQNRGENGQRVITILTDPNPEMSSHVENVVKEYVPGVKARTTTCGFGCSDHYAFSSLGYPVVCIASYGPNDPELNPNYHSTGDTVDKLDFEGIASFAKAGLAWVAEVGSS